MAKAEELFKKSAAINPKDLNLQATLAEFYSGTGQAEKGIEAYKSLITANPGNSDLKKQLAALLMRQKDYGRATAIADELIKNKDPYGRILRGQILITLKKPGEAVKEFQEAVNTDRGSSQAHYLLGTACLLTQKIQQAETEWNETLKLDANYTPAYISLAQLKLNGGDADSAMRFAQQGLRLNPNIGELHLILGDVWMSKRDFESAAKEFEMLVKHSPGNEQLDRKLVFAQINSLMNQKKPEKAIQLINQRLAQNPKQPWLYELLGQICLAQKNYAKAEAAFRKALAIDKNNIKAYSLLGRLFLVQNSRDKAIQEFKNVININPKSVMAHIMLGQVYQSLNDKEAAKSQYREALDLDPKSPAAANNLAWILADSGGDLAEAYRLAQIAMEKLPESTAVKDTLGWVYYKKGSYTPAIELLSECTRSDPKNSTFQYHLGMAYFKNGDRRKAKDYLGEAIKLGEAFPGIEEAKQVFEKL
jgi:tetratricopeptide (TPR) repeat protein